MKVENEIQRKKLLYCIPIYSLMAQEVERPIISTGLYRVIDRMQREVILTEMNFSFSGSEKYKSLNELIDDSERLAKSFASTESGTVATEIKASSEYAERKGSSIGLRTSIMKISELDSEISESDESVILAASQALTYQYQFNNIFSPGAWVGAGTGILLPEDTTENVIIPGLGLILVFGNKSDGLAFSVNRGIPLGIGLYFKNFYVGLNRLNLYEEISVPGVETGYSYYFGK